MNIYEKITFSYIIAPDSLMCAARHLFSGDFPAQYVFKVFLDAYVCTRTYVRIYCEYL